MAKKMQKIEKKYYIIKLLTEELYMGLPAKWWKGKDLVYPNEIRLRF
jgi:hypothetical protein